MSFSFSTFRMMLAIALIASSGSLIGRVYAQGSQPRGVELPRPSGKELVPDVNRLTAERAGREQLEKDLAKPPISALDNSPLHNSLKGIAPRPSRPAVLAVPNRRAQELMERRKNWIFMRPEDLTAAPSAEEMFNLPESREDGAAKKKLSPLDRYYTNMKRERKGAGKSGVDGELGRRNRTGLDDEPGSQDDSSPTTDYEEERPRGLFESDLGSSGRSSSHGGLSDIFGLGEKKPTPERSSAQKARMEEFKQLLGLPPSVQALGADPLHPLAGLNDAGPRAANWAASPLYGLPNSVGQSGFDSQSGVI